MDSDDDIYDSYDGQYSEDGDEYEYSEDCDEDGGYWEENDEDGGVSEENDEDGGVSEEIDEVRGVSEDIEEEGGASEDINEDGGFAEDVDENVGVLEDIDGGASEDNDEKDGVLEDGDEIEEDGNHGFEVVDDSDFLSCRSEDGGVAVDIDENEGISEDVDDGDHGFVGKAADDSDFLSCRPEGTYTLEFDGASKGNPGNSGAGAVLRYLDGSVARKIMKGVGVATNNEAEYEALIEGLKYAQSQGIDRIQVKGDSKLVCKQVNGDWKTRSKNLVDLNMEAKDLISKFKEFHIEYVPRESNSEADSLANKAVNLPGGKCVSR